jgi:hypothetical protein
MPPDISQLSDAELLQQAQLSQMSDADLMALAGQSAAPALDESFGGRLKNNLVAAAQGAFPLADEGAAALRSVLPGYQDYDSELNAIRGTEKAYSKEHPYQALASSLIGAGATIPAIPSAVAGKVGLTAKATQAALEGGGMGAYYGFGGGEGGLENRLMNAGKEAVIGGAVAPVATAAAYAGEKALSSASDEFLKSALNVQRSDLTKAGKFQGKGSSESSPLTGALKEAKAKGVFKGIGNDAGEFIQRNENIIDNLGDDVGNILKQADSVQTNVNIPAFDKAKKYIAEHSFQKDELQAQLDKRIDALNQDWDGTVSGLNRMKQKLYKVGYKGNTDSQGLDKALASDLRASVEDQAEQLLGKDAAEKIRQINAEQGQHLSLRDLLQKNKFKEDMPSGPALAMRRITVSPIGGAAIGLLSGNPLYALMGALGGGLATRTGQLGLSSATELGGKAAGALIDNGSKISQLVSALRADGR